MTCDICELDGPTETITKPTENVKGEYEVCSQGCARALQKILEIKTHRLQEIKEYGKVPL